LNRFVIILIIILWANHSHARQLVPMKLKESKDTLYYDPLRDHLTLKLLFTSKYSNFNINDALLNQSLNYKSVASKAIGIGAAYRWINVALSVALNDPSDSVSGEQRRIDFQTALYLRRLTINFYSGIYSGYYLQNTSQVITGWPNNSYYTRSDISSNTFGVSCFYIYNSKKYSNKASFVQKEWQKKTAGSLVAGASIIRYEVKADSSFIPTNFSDSSFFKGVDFNHSSLFSVEGQVGYAFTYVLKEHLFFSLSVIGGLGGGYTKLTPVEEEELSEVKMNLSLHNSAGFGYNSKLFFVGFNYSNLISNTQSPTENTNIGFSNGRFQLVVAYRFKIPEHKNPLPKWVPFQL
jgi:hypothetical protein